MKPIFALLILALLLRPPPAQAQGPDDQYFQIYNLIQQADTLSTGGVPDQALPRYLDAQTALQKFQRSYPDWNAKVVNFRLNYLAAKIETLSAKGPVAAGPIVPALPAPANPPEAPSPAPAPKLDPGSAGVSPAPVAAPVQPAPSADLENQLGSLQNQVRQLQNDKSLLEAKLKEALAAQPAALDPRQLAKAEEQIKALQKENDLLKATEVSNRTLADQSALASKLALENQALQARLNSSTTDAEAAAALRAENQLLKKQLADLKVAPHSPKADQGRELAQAQARLAALQSDKEILRLEKIALEDRVKQLTAPSPVAASPVPPAASSTADASRIQQLERERDDLQKKLAAATKDASGRKGKAAAARVVEMENQVAALRARLETYEAHAVPYSAEELALFKQPAARLAEANPKAGQKSVNELPAGTATLVAEAQHYFSSRQYDKAEDRYLQVLHQDDKNAYALANLAAIQLQLNHLEEAEKHIHQALLVAPDDAYSLSILGQLKFHQEKYDEALDALSRAAQFDPQNAQIQNFLGVTLSHKGLRIPAETALRRAVELEPGYGGAHNNLAVIYATQQPPALALARWHYQKALAAGHPRNPDLEKMLELARTTASSGQ